MKYGNLWRLIEKKETFVQWENYGLSISIDIAAGLTYLHETEVIHRFRNNATEKEGIYFFSRDIKSPNILIGRGMIAKITDFGLSKTVEQTTTQNTSMSIHWAAPEQFSRTAKSSTKTDIYRFVDKSQRSTFLICPIVLPSSCGKLPL